MKIRELIGSVDDFDLLQGHVEMDETYIGGYRAGKRGRGATGKTIVIGMAERDGDIRAALIPNVKKKTLREVTLANVKPGSAVPTDELMSYGSLTGNGYKHGTVTHSKYDRSHYDHQTCATHSTNHVEAFCLPNSGKESWFAIKVQV